VNIDDYLAIPYILEIWSLRRSDGQWVRHAEYPELPGCAAEAFTTIEAVEKVEAARVDFIKSRLSRGEQIPIPRQPLRA
jgi:predicted RNase H-like HicB family nuclease